LGGKEFPPRPRFFAAAIFCANKVGTLLTIEIIFLTLYKPKTNLSQAGF